jgi:hypothetical protein
MRLRTTVWIGLLLVVVGVVLVLRDSDVIGEDVSLWPIVLLTVGVLLAIGNRAATPGSWIAPLVLVAIGGVFLLRDLHVIGDDLPVGAVVLIALGAAFLLGSIGRPRSSHDRRIDISAPEATSARVSIDYGAGRLRLGSLPPGSGALCRGSVGVDAADRLVVQGDRAEVRIDHRSAALFSFPGAGRHDWTLDLDPGIPIDLVVRTGAAKSDLDLGDLRVLDLHLETGASDSHITLPRRGAVTVRVQAGAASVVIDVPPGVAARIRSDTGLASVDVDRERFPRRDGVFESAGFDTAADRADIVIKGGVGSFRVA